MGAGFNLFGSGMPPVPINDMSTQLPGAQPAAPIVDQSTSAPLTGQQRLQMQMIGRMLASALPGQSMPQMPILSSSAFAYPQGAPALPGSAPPPLFVLNRPLPPRLLGG